MKFTCVHCGKERDTTTTEAFVIASSQDGEIVAALCQATDECERITDIVTVALKDAADSTQRWRT